MGDTYLTVSRDHRTLSVTTHHVPIPHLPKPCLSCLCLGLRTLLLVLLAWASVRTRGSRQDSWSADVRDALTLPNHPVRIDARLTRRARATIGRWRAYSSSAHRTEGHRVPNHQPGWQVVLRLSAEDTGTNVINLSVDPAATVSAEMRSHLCAWEPAAGVLVGLSRSCSRVCVPRRLPQREARQEARGRAGA